MKRDMDLIRMILLNVESDKYQLGETVHLDGVSDEICARHVALLFDAGLAAGRLHRSDTHGIVGADIERLTSAGHDFLDGIRHDTIWNKVKAKFAVYGLAVLVDCVKNEVRLLALGVHPGA